MDGSNIVSFDEHSAPIRPSSSGNPSHMRSDLVEKAAEVITDPPTLINVISKRVRQLNEGRSPLVTVIGRMGAADIALTEVIEGKVVVEDDDEG